MLNGEIYQPYYENSVTVELNSLEVDAAARFGIEVWKASQDGRHKDYHVPTANGADGKRIQALGSLASWALAKYLDKWPCDYKTYQGADLSGNIEARLIGDDRYGLRVYEKDAKLEKIVVGVVIPKGKERQPIRIAGWIYAKDAMRPEWYMNPYDRERGFWCVPQEHLRHINDLPIDTALSP